MAIWLHSRAGSVAHRRRGRRRRTSTAFLWRMRARWRLFRTMLAALWASPPVILIPVSAVLIVILWLTVNWVYQAINKPTEVFFPLDDAFDKSPPETWRRYGPLFREHATAVITPELLAALAQ